MSTGSAMTRRTAETKQSKKSAKSVSSKGSKRQDVCQNHRYGKLDLFCVDHQCLICSFCRKEDHESCSNVLPLDKAANGFSQTDSAVNWDNILRKLLMQCKNVVDERRKDEKELKKNKDEIEQYVKKYRQSLVHKLDKLVQNILSEVDRIYSKENTKIQDDITELARNVKSLEDKLADIEIAKAVSADLLLFLSVQNAIQQHKTIESDLGNIHDEARKVSLKLRKTDVQITNLTIGEVELKQKPYDILPRQSGQVKPVLNENKVPIQEDSKIKLVVNLKICHSDEGTPCLTGIGTFLDNFVVVPDNNNNNIKLISPGFQLITTFPLLYPPFDVAVTSDTSFAVTSPESNEILFINVDDRRSLQQSGCIKLSHDCYGLDILDSNIVVTCLSEKCVKAIDMNGKERWTVKNDTHGEPLFIWPWYVAVNKKAKLVYVSDRNRNTITEIQHNGVHLRTIELRDSGPRGFTTDGKDNILVCCFMKDSVENLSTGLFEERSMVGTKKDGIKHPQCVALLNGEPRFILSAYQPDSLTVYEFIH